MLPVATPVPLMEVWYGYKGVDRLMPFVANPVNALLPDEMHSKTGDEVQLPFVATNIYVPFATLLVPPEQPFTKYAKEVELG